MIQNPFATTSFEKIWSKHFNQSSNALKFDFLNQILFAKHGSLPVYYNVGNKLTNGNFYSLSDNDDYKEKTFLIRDVPSYHNIKKNELDSLKQKAVFQYKGYTTKVSDYSSLDAYLRTIYKSNTRSKLRRNINRLEVCFDVEYIMYYGDISETTYHSVFKNFYKLFEKRYTDKGEPCGELDPKVWAYYTELGLTLIKDKKASLFVIYCDKVPVGITFSYHIGDILIEALTVFDIDFYRFNIGHTTILKMLEWSFKNNIKLFDYTQGDFEYKKRWSDSEYNTNYHILYDSNSLKSKVLANSMVAYFKVKRAFRELKLNKLYHSWKYKFFGNKTRASLDQSMFQIESIQPNNFDVSTSNPIDITGDKFNNLRRSLYDFLYMNPEKVSNFTFYKLNDSTYFAKSETSLLKIIKDDK
ncbi:GNAT family N-acetyltransferase [Hanstruepera marina]|uniref:GNAT family N-acetyltransferase n=1 Tax=Hanstruepera marina TaxID=2873265 RepID=UPI001CA6B019|nr:GNAT family N-acetyltransferase [Hanstruepera marina]